MQSFSLDMLSKYLAEPKKTITKTISSIYTKLSDELIHEAAHESHGKHYEDTHYGNYEYEDYENTGNGAEIYYANDDLGDDGGNQNDEHSTSAKNDDDSEVRTKDTDKDTDDVDKDKQEKEKNDYEYDYDYNGEYETTTKDDDVIENDVSSTEIQDNKDNKATEEYGSEVNGMKGNKGTPNPFNQNQAEAKVDIPHAHDTFIKAENSDKTKSVVKSLERNAEEGKENIMEGAGINELKEMKVENKEDILDALPQVESTTASLNDLDLTKGNMSDIAMIDKDSSNMNELISNIDVQPDVKNKTYSTKLAKDMSNVSPIEAPMKLEEGELIHTDAVEPQPILNEGGTKNLQQTVQSKHTSTLMDQNEVSDADLQQTREQIEELNGDRENEKLVIFYMSVLKYLSMKDKMGESKSHRISEDKRKEADLENDDDQFSESDKDDTNNVAVDDLKENEDQIKEDTGKEHEQGDKENDNTITDVEVVDNKEETQDDNIHLIPRDDKGNKDNGEEKVKMENEVNDNGIKSVNESAEQSDADDSAELDNTGDEEINVNDEKEEEIKIKDDVNENDIEKNQNENVIPLSGNISEVHNIPIVEEKDQIGTGIKEDEVKKERKDSEVETFSKSELHMKSLHTDEQYDKITIDEESEKQMKEDKTENQVRYAEENSDVNLGQIHNTDESKYSTNQDGSREDDDDVEATKDDINMEYDMKMNNFKSVKSNGYINEDDDPQLDEDDIYKLKDTDVDEINGDQTKDNNDIQIGKDSQDDVIERNIINANIEISNISNKIDGNNETEENENYVNKSKDKKDIEIEIENKGDHKMKEIGDNNDKEKTEKADNTMEMERKTANTTVAVEETIGSEIDNVDTKQNIKNDEIKESISETNNDTKSEIIHIDIDSGDNRAEVDTEEEQIQMDIKAEHLLKDYQIMQAEKSHNDYEARKTIDVNKINDISDKSNDKDSENAQSVTLDSQMDEVNKISEASAVYTNKQDNDTDKTDNEESNNLTQDDAVDNNTDDSSESNSDDEQVGRIGLDNPTEIHEPEGDNEDSPSVNEKDDIQNKNDIDDPNNNNYHGNDKVPENDVDERENLFSAYNDTDEIILSEEETHKIKDHQSNNVTEEIQQGSVNEELYDSISDQDSRENFGVNDDDDIKADNIGKNADIDKSEDNIKVNHVDIKADEDYKGVGLNERSKEDEGKMINDLKYTELEKDRESQPKNEKVDLNEEIDSVERDNNTIYEKGNNDEILKNQRSKIDLEATNAVFDLLMEYNEEHRESSVVKSGDDDTNSKEIENIKDKIQAFDEEKIKTTSETDETDVIDVQDQEMKETSFDLEAHDQSEDKEEKDNLEMKNSLKIKENSDNMDAIYEMKNETLNTDEENKDLSEKLVIDSSVDHIDMIRDDGSPKVVKQDSANQDIKSNPIDSFQAITDDIEEKKNETTIPESNETDDVSVEVNDDKAFAEYETTSESDNLHFDTLNGTDDTTVESAFSQNDEKYVSLHSNDNKDDDKVDDNDMSQGTIVPLNATKDKSSDNKDNDNDDIDDDNLSENIMVETTHSQNDTEDKSSDHIDSNTDHIDSNTDHIDDNNLSDESMVENPIPKNDTEDKSSENNDKNDNYTDDVSDDDESDDSIVGNTLSKNDTEDNSLDDYDNNEVHNDEDDSSDDGMVGDANLQSDAEIISSDDNDDKDVDDDDLSDDTLKHDDILENTHPQNETEDIYSDKNVNNDDDNDEADDDLLDNNMAEHAFSQNDKEDISSENNYSKDDGDDNDDSIKEMKYKIATETSFADSKNTNGVKSIDRVTQINLKSNATSITDSNNAFKKEPVDNLTTAKDTLSTTESTIANNTENEKTNDLESAQLKSTTATTVILDSWSEEYLPNNEAPSVNPFLKISADVNEQGSNSSSVSEDISQTSSNQNATILSQVQSNITVLELEHLPTANTSMNEQIETEPTMPKMKNKAENFLIIDLEGNNTKTESLEELSIELQNYTSSLSLGAGVTDATVSNNTSSIGGNETIESNFDIQITSDYKEVVTDTRLVQNENKTSTPVKQPSVTNTMDIKDQKEAMDLTTANVDSNKPTAMEQIKTVESDVPKEKTSTSKTILKGEKQSSEQNNKEMLSFAEHLKKMANLKKNLQKSKIVDVPETKNVTKSAVKQIEQQVAETQIERGNNVKEEKGKKNVNTTLVTSKVEKLSKISKDLKKVSTKNKKYSKNTESKNVTKPQSAPQRKKIPLKERRLSSGERRLMLQKQFMKMKQYMKMKKLSNGNKTVSKKNSARSNLLKRGQNIVNKKKLRSQRNDDDDDDDRKQKKRVRNQNNLRMKGRASNMSSRRMKQMNTLQKLKHLMRQRQRKRRLLSRKSKTSTEKGDDSGLKKKLAVKLGSKQTNKKKMLQKFIQMMKKMKKPFAMFVKVD